MKKSSVISQSPPTGTVEQISPTSLSLDSKNPRLLQYGIGTKASQNEIIEDLWEHMAVDEVAMSIAADGYWNHEHLFVIKEGKKDVVIEGNRRLAAVMILLDPKLQSQIKINILKNLERINHSTSNKYYFVKYVNNCLSKLNNNNGLLLDIKEYRHSYFKKETLLTN